MCWISTNGPNFGSLFKFLWFHSYQKTDIASIYPYLILSWNVLDIFFGTNLFMKKIKRCVPWKGRFKDVLNITPPILLYIYIKLYLDNPSVQNYRSKSETAIIIAGCLNFRRFQFLFAGSSDFFAVSLDFFAVSKPANTCKNIGKIAKLQQYKDCSEAEKNAVPPAIIPEKAIILQCFANFKPTLKHLKAKPSSDCHATRSAMPKKVRGPGRLGECGSAAEEFELALCHLLSGLRREPRGGPTWEGWGWG